MSHHTTKPLHHFISLAVYMLLSIVAATCLMLAFYAYDTGVRRGYERGLQERQYMIERACVSALAG